MNNLFGRCDACVRDEGNHFRYLCKYGESTPTMTPTHKPIRKDPDSQQSERAENGALPAVRETVRETKDVSCRIKQCVCTVWKPLHLLK
jgi:hypothetical protein